MLEKYGAGEWTRTIDLLITNQLLYQLSYAGKARSLDHEKTGYHDARIAPGGSVLPDKRQSVWAAPSRGAQPGLT